MTRSAPPARRVCAAHARGRRHAQPPTTHARNVRAARPEPGGYRLTRTCNFLSGAVRILALVSSRSRNATSFPPQLRAQHHPPQHAPAADDHMGSSVRGARHAPRLAVESAAAFIRSCRSGLARVLCRLQIATPGAHQPAAARPCSASRRLRRASPVRGDCELRRRR